MLATTRVLWKFRALLGTLISRELKARYRGSALGFLWSLLNPLLLLTVYAVVFGLVLTPPRGEDVKPYAVFLVSGLFPWIWFSTSVLEGAAAITQNSGLVRKAVFPAELLPMVAVGSHLVHFFLALPIVAAALIVGRGLGFPVGGWGVLAVPFVIALQLPFVAGLALGLSALTVHFKDVRDILANLLTLTFFATPIIYPLSAVPVPAIQTVLRCNPVTPFALAYQEALFAGRFPAPGLWLHMLAVALVAWAFGTWLFRRLRETVVEAL